MRPVHMLEMYEAEARFELEGVPAPEESGVSGESLRSEELMMFGVEAGQKVRWVGRYR